MDPAGAGNGADGPRFRFVRADACAMCGAAASGFRRMGARLDRHQGLWPVRRSGVRATVVRCGECGLLFSDPMPLPESVSALYGVEPAEYWPEDYFRVDPDYLRTQCEVARDLLGRRDGLTALDVGAGIGKGLLALERHGFSAVGLEPSREFREFALRRMGLTEDRMVLGAVEDAAFPPDSFDYVNLSAILEHVRDPRGALARAVGWTRPGGIIHAEVPSARWLLSRSLNAWYRVTGQGFVTNTSPMHIPYHLYEFTPRAFELAVAALSCGMERWEVWTGDVMVPRALRGILGWIMQSTGTGMQLAVWLRKR